MKPNLKNKNVKIKPSDIKSPLPTKGQRNDLNSLKSLGQSGTDYKLEGRDPSVLETFNNRFPNNYYTVTFRQEGEFSSLCPRTKQPDFAEFIEITYVPDKKCIESKSLKLYLFSYRNQKDFGEDICNEILNDLVECCDPIDMQVTVKMKPRGGISWEPKAYYCKEQKDDKNKQ